MSTYLIRWKIDKNLLGFFVARNLTELAYDQLDQYADPAQFEYFLVKEGGFVFEKNTSHIVEQDNVVRMKAQNREDEHVHSLDGVVINWDYNNSNWEETGEEEPIFIAPQTFTLSFSEPLDEKVSDTRGWKSVEDPASREHMKKSYSITSEATAKTVAGFMHGIPVEDDD